MNSVVFKYIFINSNNQILNNFIIEEKEKEGQHA